MPGSANMDEHYKHYPTNVGIIAIDVYFPSQYVDQGELELYDGISTGKYTIGLGQDKMGFCTDREDINSLCLTVVERLMRKLEGHISYEHIGRLEVGTETIVDKSKSVKSVLMQLFEECENTDMEGIDTTNACYGGTAALFNAINWIESSSWDGRYALVVAGDIAVYATGNARCTGGAGAVAMILGEYAPLVFDRYARGIHMQHVYDFYKPDLASEYPVVDGKLSVQCYQHALDMCYERYSGKAKQEGFKEGSSLIDMADGVLFHSPYCKLVQKSFARLMANDFLSDPNPDFKGRYAGLEAFRDMQLDQCYFDKEVEKAFMTASKPLFEEKTRKSMLLGNQVGNMYTPSLYGGLVSHLVSHTVEQLAGQRIVLFSYGSGLASSMFSLRITDDTSLGSGLQTLYSCLFDVKSRLESRQKIPPQDFDRIMKLREDTHNKAPYVPVGPTDTLFPGTWYLTGIDSMHRRSYATVPPLPTSVANGHATSSVQPTPVDLSRQRKRKTEDETGSSSVKMSSPSLPGDSSLVPDVIAPSAIVETKQSSVLEACQSGVTAKISQS
ncbi:hydroxymethylglutaryl-CoA synthase 1-like isoform X1 [Mizuhopecten yessoensis]|uniref:hydroxymethylglutaryl-CoA synthase 1-like isoform X1 n=1 Tax=Mizuhopecten yessoensis TaxID=6573 RepID=UPI000B458A02|nr:hydroxymethylglutaryl-CoA synthase 1-like isoform X1 [Mizuhopecten yessoensis]XP_021356764.1 hydroxymethylglutaryl-CoA synthase 1-like isoform X1 [Mizuhopecten yessoensis]XP_021356765.1 hydroxymethylglutaryl-CoA synthase 1-like isoform X1 [Mizuhopecten yessoensis]XP_021356766.1 hydroxymethylglutaryl-CoA synthase 1-like isoform X1 [Mizuhopecten yessoensis]XP_021356767.1 hydroxymethylglutaryl-CoA synthase 1-like isoform X1 [Mizuhopecten yessoensis]